LLKPFGYNTSLSKEYLASGAAGSTMSSSLMDNPYMRAAQAGNHAPMARLWESRWSRSSTLPPRSATSWKRLPR
jgi:hypothetical protein